MLHHIEINVANLKKSAEFWGWLLTELNYEVFQEWESGISWKQGNSYLVFVQTDDRFIDSGYHRGRIGLNHLAFHGESREHVNKLFTKLKEKGIPLLYEERFPFAGGPNHYAVFFEDPDRMKVEIVAPNE